MLKQDSKHIAFDTLLKFKQKVHLKDADKVGQHHKNDY